ncbi:hypothetical protein AGMMS49944_23390 [Spirochaetia bacterium]|nr:hypothetical protein AGMMS49944_23390 [Spirochaetia bacterium]
MKRLFSIFTIVVGFMLPLYTLSAQSGIGGRYALVIGEGGYQYMKPVLTNPLNDADDMTTALRSLGFTVDLLKDASLRDINIAVTRLKENLAQSPDNYGFFYYAGHGMQSEGKNYLLPAEARISTAADLRRTALDVQNVYEELRAAGNALNVVVLDACRNNPFARAISLTEDGQLAQGLAAVVYQPANSVIVYATAAGETASDGSGRNGLFTGKLLANLKKTNLEVLEVFRETADAVQTESGNTQIPAIFSAFHKHAYFQKGKTAQTKTTPVLAAAPVTIEPRAPGRPVWVDQPLKYAQANFETTARTTNATPEWYYAVGISTRTTTEQRARTRAQQNVQMDAASNVASDFKARIDITEHSTFKDGDIEDCERLIETAITNSIKTRVPRFEILEWYIDKGNEAGKDWYNAYVLVHFSRSDMINVINKIDPEKVVDTLVSEAQRNKVIPANAQLSARDKSAMVEMFIEIREYASEGVEKGLSGY